MFEPITFESDKLLIHPIRKIDMANIGRLAEDIYNVLSDDLVLKFIPEKRLVDIQQAHDYLFKTVTGYQHGVSFAHFVTIKEIDRTLGVINLISPKYSQLVYKMREDNWMIEYYMASSAWGRNIMTEILPYFIKRFFSQNIGKLGALTFNNNYASINLLTKAGFSKAYSLNLTQDYYELPNNNI